MEMQAITCGIRSPDSGKSLLILYRNAKLFRPETLTLAPYSMAVLAWPRTMGPSVPLNQVDDADEDADEDAVEDGERF